MDAAAISATAACIAAAGVPFAAFLNFLQNRTLRAKVADVETKIDGPLQALISSIRAEAELKIARAQAETRHAFSAGQDQPRAPDPEVMKAIAVEAVRAVTDGTPPR